MFRDPAAGFDIFNMGSLWGSSHFLQQALSKGQRPSLLELIHSFGLGISVFRGNPPYFEAPSVSGGMSVLGTRPLYLERYNIGDNVSLNRPHPTTDGQADRKTDIQTGDRVGCLTDKQTHRQTPANVKINFPLQTQSVATKFGSKLVLFIRAHNNIMKSRSTVLYSL